ncbi:hypothetical protein SLEP1_g19193 [Rubroshorea leprosula]|nr:hypothetical protein SLEP1_g19193 [Rubroshorea leprosula]
MKYEASVSLFKTIINLGLVRSFCFEYPMCRLVGSGVYSKLFDQGSIIWAGGNSSQITYG